MVAIPPNQVSLPQHDIQSFMRTLKPCVHSRFFALGFSRFPDTETQRRDSLIPERVSFRVDHFGMPPMKEISPGYRVLQVAFLSVTGAALSACTVTWPTPPAVLGPTPASLSTLRSHQSNKFTAIDTFNNGRTDYLLPNPNNKYIWAYGFLMPGHRYAIYNVLDVDKLTRSGSGTAEVTLKNGQMFKTSTLYMHIYRCSDIHTCQNTNLRDQKYFPFQQLSSRKIQQTINDPAHHRWATAFTYAFTDQNPFIPSGDGFGYVIENVKIVPGTAGLELRLRRMYAADSRVNEAYARASAKRKIAREQARRALVHNVAVDTRRMRKHIKIGTETNCGSVFELRLPMVGVQTPKGMQYIPLNNLYSPNVGCEFQHGLYVGPIYQFNY